MKETEHTQPADIERTSMAIISHELETMGICLAPENAAVIRRIIHTTADFDYAKNLRFIEGATAAGVVALQRGETIVTDTNMARSGLSKPSLSRLGGQAVCYMADLTVAQSARENGTTRAVASMRRAAAEYPNSVIAVGNAPTALLELCRLMEEGFRPSLVIGVPVGFVNVVESKETLLTTCERLHVPAIVAMGRKGGSTVAAAICNALLYTATDTLDPAKRGWN